MSDVKAILTWTYRALVPRGTLGAKYDVQSAGPYLESQRASRPDHPKRQKVHQEAQERRAAVRHRVGHDLPHAILVRRIGGSLRTSNRPRSEDD
jgi:hypothetical protein